MISSLWSYTAESSQNENSNTNHFWPAKQVHHALLGTFPCITSIFSTVDDNATWLFGYLLMHCISPPKLPPSPPVFLGVLKGDLTCVHKQVLSLIIFTGHYCVCHAHIAANCGHLFCWGFSGHYHHPHMLLLTDIICWPSLAIPLAITVDGQKVSQL